MESGKSCGATGMVSGGTSTNGSVASGGKGGMAAGKKGGTDKTSASRTASLSSDFLSWTLNDVLLDERKDNRTFQPIPRQAFTDSESYFSAFRPLVAEELRMTLAKSFKDVMERPAEQRNIPVDLTVESSDQLRLSIPRARIHKEGDIRPLDLLLLTTSTNMKKAARDSHLFALVSRVTDTLKRRGGEAEVFTVTVRVNKDTARCQFHAADDRRQWYMARLESVATAVRIFQALERKEQPAFFQHILHPRPKKDAQAIANKENVRTAGDNLTNNAQVGKDTSKWIEKLDEKIVADLNDSQRRAIQEIIERKERFINLIQGPPGTGTFCVRKLNF
jgi:hypothetical protein